MIKTHLQLNNIEKEIVITQKDLRLDGILATPKEASIAVIFAHGSGSSRFSHRNLQVARLLQDRGMVTLLMDLLTREEEDSREKVFNIELLASRLIAAKQWLHKQKETRDCLTGYFGASTGAAAALVAAAREPAGVFAVVSRGGRPDLAGTHLRSVQAPTLLLVGGEDHRVIELNRQALNELHCEKQLEIISGATHLFEEPGTLGTVASLAANWFESHGAKTANQARARSSYLDEGRVPL